MKYIKYESGIGIITMPVHAIALEAQYDENYLVRNVYTDTIYPVSKEVFSRIEELLNSTE